LLPVHYLPDSHDISPSSGTTDLLILVASCCGATYALICIGFYYLQ
jgi:hypothetical protein